MPPRDERETETGTRQPVASTAPPGPAPGDVLAGAYRIERVLGRGGMGVVFEATDVRLDRTVALKTLAPGALATPEQRARFEREARALARLDGNEHVARVLWFGEIEGGAALLVMEHLVGRDLRSELRQHGPLAEADAVRFTLHACDALAEAHAAGIIHRDLKPSNLFLGRDRGNAPLLKVLDFGVTKSQSRREGELATASHAFLGSLPFVSPEQLASTRDADARSDVWSLGVTLYEMLTGRLPFEGRSDADLAVAIERHRPAPPSRLRPDLSPGLDGVVLACLEKDPARRTPDMLTLARALLPYAPDSMDACVANIERRSGDFPGGAASRSLPSRRAQPSVEPPEPSPQGLSRGSAEMVIPGVKPAAGPLARWSLLAAALVLAGLLGAAVSRRGPVEPQGASPVAALDSAAAAGTLASSTSGVTAQQRSSALEPLAGVAPTPPISAASVPAGAASPRDANVPIVFPSNRSPEPGSAHSRAGSMAATALDPVAAQPSAAAPSEPPGALSSSSPPSAAPSPPPSMIPAASASSVHPFPSPIRTGAPPPILDADDPPIIVR